MACLLLAGKAVTVAQLTRLCRLWQKRLRITDWTITVRRGTEKEMPDCTGSTLYDPRGMSATMLIRQNPEDPGYADGGIEHTVIHELLHVVIHGDKEFRREDIMRERGINQVADALYRAYRRRK